MSACLAETCVNWTGDGCICAVLDLDPVDARTIEFPCPEDEHVGVDRDGFCRGCGLTVEEDQR
jgi:hypothetical protein